jgi:hypothetical protein
MTIAANGRVPMTNPGAVQMRDLTDKNVQADIRKVALKNAEMTRARMIRALNKRDKKA